MDPVTNWMIESSRKPRSWWTKPRNLLTGAGLLAAAVVAGGVAVKTSPDESRPVAERLAISVVEPAVEEFIPKPIVPTPDPQVAIPNPSHAVLKPKDTDPQEETIPNKPAIESARDNEPSNRLKQETIDNLRRAGLIPR